MKAKLEEVPEVYHLTREVVKMTGATPRQLQWWDEHGILSPKRRHGDRAYSERDVRLVKRLITLRKAGVPLHLAESLMESSAWSRAVATRSQVVIIGDTLICFTGIQEKRKEKWASTGKRR